MQDTKELSPSLAAALVLLASHPDYRVLRRIPEMPVLAEVPEGAEIGLIVDTETTGLTADDRIVEFGCVSFAFDPIEGRVLGVVDAYSGLEDAGRPIDPAASKVSGITDEMVKGLVLDDERIRAMAGRASVVIAHKAEFDRPKVEARLPFFSEMNWVCSVSQVPWGEAGIESNKQKFIASELGYIYDGHRTDSDCRALLHVLGIPLTKVGGKTGLGFLLDALVQPSYRLWATGTPFHAKEELKRRDYRWSGGDIPGWEKAWYLDLPSKEALDAESAWLREKIYRCPFSVPVSVMDAKNRFSPRLNKVRHYVD